MRRRLALVVGVLLGGFALPAALMLSAAPLLAQRPDTARTDSARLTLPAVTVSTTRDERPAFVLPLAATRVTPEQRFGAAGQGLDQALTSVPGVLAQSRGGWTDIRLTIRGFGARGAGDRSNAGTSRGIRVLLDGVPETEPDGRTAFDNVDLAALDGIEVVRSNVSSLWGNAAGGIVSLSTVPDHGHSTLSAGLAAGTFGLRRAVLAASAPLEGGAVSATLVRGTLDGYRAHSDAERWLGNLAAVTTLGGRTRLGAFAVVSENAYRIPGPLTRTQADSAPEQANATYLARDERRHNRQARIAMSLEHELPAGLRVSGMLFAAPKVLQRSERGTFRDFTRYHVGGNLLLHAERRLGGELEGRLVAGADEAYQDGAILFYSLTPAGGRGDTLRTNKREGANNAGLFVQGELDVGTRWVVVAGARYDAIRYTYRDFLQPQLDAEQTFSRVTPKLGVTWRASPRHVVYASVGGGIEAPAANETDPPGTFGQDTVTGLNPLLEPIRSTSAEVGTRHLLPLPGSRLVRALAYDAALFTTAVANEIVPYRGGQFFLTAGRARRSGLELSATVHGAAGLRLEPSLTLITSQYLAYVVDSAHYGVPGRAADYSGNTQVGIPGASWAVALAWAPAGRLPLSARLSVHGNADYWADDANTVRVPGFAVTDLTLGLAAPVRVAGGCGVRGFVTVNNVFDRQYLGSAYLNPDVVNGEPVAFEPGMPRQLVVSISMGWL